MERERMTNCLDLKIQVMESLFTATTGVSDIQLVVYAGREFGGRSPCETWRWCVANHGLIQARIAAVDQEMLG